MDAQQHSAGKLTTAMAPSHAVPPSVLLQRKCACGGTPNVSGECAECQDKRLQRRAGSATAAPAMPAIVQAVVNSPGQPLDAASREYFEPRLGQLLHSGAAPREALSLRSQTISEPGDPLEREADRAAEQLTGARADDIGDRSSLRYDLSKIRIHADGQAAASAQAVNALAYTVGQHIVFGAATDRRLLAHELVHTVQQNSGIARQQKSPAGPCLTAAACKDVKTPTQLLKEGKASGSTSRGQREKHCNAKPPDPQCRADGHADRAVETEKLLGGYDPSRFAHTEGIFIDADLEDDFGAMTLSCAGFTPALADSGHCITVPAAMERQAALFNSTAGPEAKIDGEDRDLWRAHTLEILVHEAEHTRFRSLMSPQFKGGPGVVPEMLGAPRPSCPKSIEGLQNIRSSLNELGAMMQEFPMRMELLRSHVGLSADDKRKELEEWRDHRVRGTNQSITNSLKVVRCLCGCEDAEALIVRTIDFATESWTLKERLELDRELADRQWDSLDLRWPTYLSTLPKGDFPRRTLPEGTEIA